MALRYLVGLLIGLAMAVAPLGMPAMAAAPTPAGHHEKMTGQGHCDQQPKPDQHHRTADKGCCAAMCIGVVVPESAAELALYQAERERPTSDQSRRGYLGEIATPPPKLA
jgi:hypothetical protein